MFDGSVCRTEDKEARYTLAEGITSFALNCDETLLAVGWRNGETAVFELTVIDMASRAIEDAFHLGPGSREVAAAEADPHRLDLRAQGARFGLLQTLLQHLEMSANEDQPLHAVEALEVVVDPLPILRQLEKRSTPTPWP